MNLFKRLFQSWHKHQDMISGIRKSSTHELIVERNRLLDRKRKAALSVYEHVHLTQISSELRVRASQ